MLLTELSQSKPNLWSESQRQERHETGYHNTVQIHDPQIARSVYERAMATPITVTQRELLSLAPEVWTQVAKAMIKQRIPQEAAAQAMLEDDSKDSMLPPSEKWVHFKPVPHATIEEIPNEDSPTPLTNNEALNQHMPALVASNIIIQN